MIKYEFNEKLKNELINQKRPNVYENKNLKFDFVNQFLKEYYPDSYKKEYEEKNQFYDGIGESLMEIAGAYCSEYECMNELAKYYYWDVTEEDLDKLNSFVYEFDKYEEFIEEKWLELNPHVFKYKSGDEVSFESRGGKIQGVIQEQNEITGHAKQGYYLVLTEENVKDNLKMLKNGGTGKILGTHYPFEDVEMLNQDQ